MKKRIVAIGVIVLVVSGAGILGYNILREPAGFAEVMYCPVLLNDDELYFGSKDDTVNYPEEAYVAEVASEAPSLDSNVLTAFDRLGFKLRISTDRLSGNTFSAKKREIFVSAQPASLQHQNQKVTHPM